MVRDRRGNEVPIHGEQAISIVGPGMTFVGDCVTEGALRIEGTVEGSVRAGGEVVVGEGGIVRGDLRAHAATVAGEVHGTLVADLLLELRETSRLEGEVYAARIRVGDGAVVNASVHMGEEAVQRASGAGRTPPPLRLEQAGAHGASAETTETGASVGDEEPEAKRKTS